MSRTAVLLRYSHWVQWFRRTFVLSFIKVGVYWVAQHHMLHFVTQVNRRLLWLNLLLLLLCVVFIPFPTSLLGDRLQ